MSNQVSQFNIAQGFTFWNILTQTYTNKEGHEKAFIDLGTLLNCREVCKEFKKNIDEYLAKFQTLFFKNEKELALAHNYLRKKEASLISEAQPLIMKLKGYLTGNQLNHTQQGLLPLAKMARTNENSEESQINRFIEKVTSNQLTWADCHAMQFSSMGCALGFNTSTEMDHLKTLTQEKEKIQVVTQALKKQAVGLDLMSELIGGQETFEQLPILDISSLKQDESDYIDQVIEDLDEVAEEGMGYVFAADNSQPLPKDSSPIDYIPYHALTAPIMRGVDKFHRHFIVLRTESRKDPSIKGGQVFFQNSKLDGKWAYAWLKTESNRDTVFIPRTILDFEGYLIDETNQMDALSKHPTAFQTLADFIKNGGNEEYKLV